MKEAEKKFIKKFGEKKLIQLRRCRRLGLKMCEMELLTKLSQKQIYYWKTKIFEE